MMRLSSFLYINWFKIFVYFAVGIVLIGITALITMFIVFVLPIITRGDLEGIFSLSWQPNEGHFGILPMIGGSFFLVIFALLVACPLALGLTIWMLKINRRYLARGVSWLIRFMIAIPTVVYGFVSVFLLVPLVREGVGGTGFCLFSAGVILALLITPTITLVFETGITSSLEKLCPGGLALGFSRLELFYFFVLPKAKKKFVVAAMIGFGRAIGDTLISLMLSGNAPQFPQGIFESIRTLTAHIALISANEVGGVAYDSLFLSGILLLSINALVSITLRHVAKVS